MPQEGHRVSGKMYNQQKNVTLLKRAGEESANTFFYPAYVIPFRVFHNRLLQVPAACSLSVILQEALGKKAKATCDPTPLFSQCMSPTVFILFKTRNELGE